MLTTDMTGDIFSVKLTYRGKEDGKSKDLACLWKKTCR